MNPEGSRLAFRGAESDPAIPRPGGLEDHGPGTALGPHRSVFLDDVGGRGVARDCETGEDQADARSVVRIFVLMTSSFPFNLSNPMMRVWTGYVRMHTTRYPKSFVNTHVPQNR